MLVVAPDHLTLTFSEPVSPLVLGLVQPDGDRLPLEKFILRDRELSIESPAHLRNGTHVLTWRVVSEDGHPIGGSVVFSIGTHTAPPSQTSGTSGLPVLALLWAGKVGPLLRALPRCRGRFCPQMAVSAILTNKFLRVSPDLGRSSFVARAACCPRPRRTGPPTFEYFPADCLGDWCPHNSRPLAGGSSRVIRRSSSLQPHAWKNGVCTRFAWTGRNRRGARPYGPCKQRPTSILHPACRGTAWCGRGFLGWCPAAPRVGTPKTVGRRDCGVAAVLPDHPYLHRHSHHFRSGAGIHSIRSVPDLWRTEYGQVLLVKLGLVFILLLFAALNRWHLTVPTAQGNQNLRKQLVRSIGVELVVVLLIFGTVAGWRFTPPPRNIVSGQPVMVNLHGDRAMAHMTVNQNSAGPVTLRFMLMKPNGEMLAAKELSVALSLPSAGVEPIRRKAKPGNDGHWSIDEFVIPLPGTWTVEVNVLVSDFEVAKLVGELTIQ